MPIEEVEGLQKDPDWTVRKSSEDSADDKTHRSRNEPWIVDEIIRLPYFNPASCRLRTGIVNLRPPRAEDIYYRFNLSFRDVEDILAGIVKLRKFRSTETPDIVVRQDEGRDAMRTGLGRKPAT